MRLDGRLRSTSAPLYPSTLFANTQRRRYRGAHRNVYQKTTALESPHRDQGGGNRRGPARGHRPPRSAAAAVWGVPAAMSSGGECETGAGMARSVHAEDGVDAALPAAAGRLPALRGPGGGRAVGGALGARDDGAGKCRVGPGPRAELAGGGAPVRVELEECGHD